MNEKELEKKGSEVRKTSSRKGIKMSQEELNARRIRKIPTPDLMSRIWEYISVKRPNQRGEFQRPNHECIFLLCWKAGLRVTEAINFDLANKSDDPSYVDYYKILGKGSKKTQGAKIRYAYISPWLLKELQIRNWIPNKDGIGRIAFYDFLQRIREEMKIEKNIEFAPHTLRRCFASHNVNNGMPIPTMQKYLGHADIATTIKYLRDCTSSLEAMDKHKPTN